MNLVHVSVHNLMHDNKLSRSIVMLRVLYSDATEPAISSADIFANFDLVTRTPTPIGPHGTPHLPPSDPMGPHLTRWDPTP